jgi:riboflavin synthase
MFTGIVSGVGRVMQKQAGRIGIEHSVAERLKVGGSIAVNGACLTITELAATAFFADCVPETASRTNLGTLKPGDQVNLELPLRLDQPLDGHLVQGHIDATGTITKVAPEPPGKRMNVSFPSDLHPFMAEKGSIAVDGVSLTIAALDDDRNEFEVALIPHTIANTIARDYASGAEVNLEVDLLARYVARITRAAI